jgi:hypothetical protein
MGSGMRCALLGIEACGGPRWCASGCWAVSRFWWGLVLSHRTTGSYGRRRRSSSCSPWLLAIACTESRRWISWPESGRRAASNSLRTALHAARKVVDPEAGCHYLASEVESLVLCSESSLWVYVDAFEEVANTARRSQDPVAYRAAIALYAGELLLDDRYQAWAQSCGGCSSRDGTNIAKKPED